MNASNSLFTFLIDEIDKLSKRNTVDFLQSICDILQAQVSYYNWVGFYFMNHEKKQLEVGPYTGEKTNHITIPFGQGICGQVAVSGQAIEVPDVTVSDNYLSCSLATKSEIVIPIYIGEKLVGQLDVDSHQLDPFTQEDHDFLNEICSRVANELRLLAGADGINRIHIGG